MSATCRLVAMRLPGVESTSELGPRLATHAASCLRCQAEAARYRSLRRRLAELEDVAHPAPEGFVATVMSRLAEPLSDVVALPRRYLPSPATVAAAATGAAVVLTGVAMVLRRLQAPA
jgi:hypothetical protein